MNNPYFQFSGSIFVALFVLVALFFLFIFLPVSIVAEAFSKLGLTPVQGILMLMAIVVGRTVNIPVYTSPRLIMVARQRSMTFAMDAQGRSMRIEEEPANELKKQVFAVNVGGCVLPVLLSLTFLLSMNGGMTGPVLGWIAFALIMVAGGCYAMVKTDPFTGLRIPLFMPALMTFVSVYFFVPEPVRPVAAYVAGTIGTILGGNLVAIMTPRIRNAIAVPLVSIGGAGTFGGVFVAGVLAVLLA
jgi:uncharacterized membrane protein